jgi:hypothetical protein
MIIEDVNPIELLDAFDHASGLDSGYKFTDDEMDYITDLIKKDMLEVD